MDLQAAIRERRNEILAIARRHGAENVRVFGSVARGEATAASDLDLLVDVAPVHSSWFPGGLLMDLEQLLGCRVDIATPDALHWFIRDRILAEARPL